MSRYIDATDIAKQIADFKRVVNSPNSDYMTGYLCALSVTEGMIAKTPTADVAEVRHEHWVVCGAFDDFLKCSSCGYDRPWQTAIEHKYCPNCGAKMGGERREE